MAQPAELTRLAQQRRLLATQSNALRQQMADDFNGLQHSVAWIDRVYSFARPSRALWPILAGIFGLLLARRGGGTFRKVGRLLSWWRVLKQITPLWRSFTTPS